MKNSIQRNRRVRKTDLLPTYLLTFGGVFHMFCCTLYYPTVSILSTLFLFCFITSGVSETGYY